MPPEAKGKFALPFGSETITFTIEVLIKVQKDYEKDCDQERLTTASSMKPCKFITSLNQKNDPIILQ